ncbi:MAG: methyltransferase domain-containing protein [Rikenellaceae bacterium]
MKRKASEKAQRRKEMSDNYINQRKRLVYQHTSELISGKVLLVGAERNFDVSIFATKAESLTIVDKAVKDLSDTSLTNVEYHFNKFPSLSGLTSNSFDFVLSFQSIEHIPDDFYFMKEVVRVLRAGGKFIVSTPNKAMSITRNPWHRREYTVDEFKNLLSSYFNQVQALGIYGKNNVLEYYDKNKRAVKAYKRFDIFDFEHRLPSWLLKLPYHTLNIFNRHRLLINNRNLTLKISKEDYYIDKASDGCFDLYFIAEK